MSNFTAAPKSMLPVTGRAAKVHNAGGNTTTVMSANSNSSFGFGKNPLKMSRSTDMMFNKQQPMRKSSQI